MWKRHELSQRQARDRVHFQQFIYSVIACAMYLRQLSIHLAGPSCCRLAACQRALSPPHTLSRVRERRNSVRQTGGMANLTRCQNMNYCPHVYFVNNLSMRMFTFSIHVTNSRLLANANRARSSRKHADEHSRLGIAFYFSYLSTNERYSTLAPKAGQLRYSICRNCIQAITNYPATQN